MRDFPTPDFGSAVVNKNFLFATGNQRKCEDEQLAADENATKERESNTDYF